MQDTINYIDLAEQCRLIVGSDTARISKPLDRMFLIIGYNRDTKEDKGSHFINENNERFDFKYVVEQVIANGYTVEELISNTKEYVRLSNMTMEEYLKELLNK